MFQRLKGAIDTRIAEEQARQRQATQAASGRPPARRRPQNQNGTPARSPAGPREALTTEKGPDPKEFDPEFVNEEPDNTRISAGDAEKNGPTKQVEEGALPGEPDVQAVEAGKPNEDDSNAPPQEKVSDLPVEVKSKLRKLERLESKYGELLKAYRAAHARVQIIEPFETSLRENTPLTSIADPSALVEYLNQVKLKGDMVLDEFKKVSADRDAYKKKFEQSETDATSLRLEVEALKTNAKEVNTVAVSGEGVQTSDTATPVTKDSDTDTKPAADSEGEVKSPSSTSRIPSISLFSPKFGSKKEEPKETSEDLFSYDSELPRLEAELQQRTDEAETLKRQLNSLQGDLKVARESTEGMVQTLEHTTRELNGLRDIHDKLEATNSALEKRISEMEADATGSSSNLETLQKTIDELQKHKDEAEAASRQLKDQIQILEKSEVDLQAQIEAVRASNETANESDRIEKDIALQKLHEAQTKVQRLERENMEQDERREKKLATMQGIIDNVRAKLDTSEAAVIDLKREIQVKQDEYTSRPSTKVFGFLDEEAASKSLHFNTRDDAIKHLANAFGLKKDDGPAVTVAAASSPALPEATTSTTNKKKKNKKKRGGKGAQNVAEEPEQDTPVKVSEDLSEMPDESGQPEQSHNAVTAELQEQLSQLESELQEKTTAIDRLTSQIKDQEALREEIETLRDDLLHQGEEHVEARDALKTAQEARHALQQNISSLEKELAEARKDIAAKVALEKKHHELDEKHQDLASKFDELKSKFTTLETDLKAAEQLATGRFKDISDLKELLSKAQPELRSLRSEVVELKSAREDLKSKQGELSRLEAKHEDMKSDMKSLGRKLGDKDSEIKILQEKIEQEAKARSRVEDELTGTKSELRVAESRRSEMQEQSNQTSRDLTKVKEEASSLRTKLRQLDEQASSQARELSGLREEISLKTALHSSSQSLVQSLRDQTHELNTQAREASARAESLDEELAEAQRMLSERTRESQTMRILLNQAESGTESRIREMKERMDAAIEERDRIEDEASVSNRRSMREVEDTKTKARDAQRQLKALEDERDDLENKAREWRRTRDDLEHAAESASKEVEEVRTAMKGLREALDESERQIREAETQRIDLRHQSDEATERVEKLTRANKNLTEEIKNLQSGNSKKGTLRPAGAGATNTTGTESGLQSSRTSIDSTSTRSPALPPVVRGISRTGTPTLANTSNSTNTTSNQTNVDYVYLKNVLLQFMEGKNKMHQRQLIPVLGMLLHFDRNDEQKWMSVVSAK